MVTYNLKLGLTSKTVYVAQAPNTIPNTVASEALVDLGNFVHELGTDTFPGSTKFPDNHVLFHHVRERLYKTLQTNGAQGAKYPKGIYNLHDYKLKYYGLLAESNGIKSDSITVEDNSTATIVVKYLPSGTNATLTDFTYVSENPAVATVSTGGVVTGVTVGTTHINITAKSNLYSTKIKVNVTPDTTP